ncbi:MAG: MlaD family protein [Methylacidiphilales bacterium]|nr:MlaD family protein [Candidatus Methylacidiphilales bacterium]MDW8349483.1 MlaD family protein [Verrucomicrobiae bacterium]
MTNPTLERSVGFFILIGLIAIGWLIIQFGRLGETYQQSYIITVEFPNASGLLKGSQVMMAGALIGRVLNTPQPIKDGAAIQVIMRIRKDVKIRRNAKFLIGSMGMLGDRFVDVQPQPVPEGEEVDFIRDGDTIISGGRTSDLSDLTNAAKPLIERLNDIAKRLDSITTKLDTSILTEQSTKDLRESFAHLKSLLANTDKTIQEAQSLIRDARQQKGALSKLIYDESLANDLAAFVANLRRKGILFYSDESGRSETPPARLPERDPRKKTRR